VCVCVFCFDNSGHVKWGVNHCLYVTTMSFAHTRQFVALESSTVLSLFFMKTVILPF
jgi:hypothetical protein